MLNENKTVTISRRTAVQLMVGVFVLLGLLAFQWYEKVESRQLSAYLLTRVLLSEKAVSQDQFVLTTQVYPLQHAATEQLIQQTKLERYSHKLEQYIKHVNPKVKEQAAAISSSLVQCAAKYKLDWIKYAALVEQESHFNPLAVGGQGERGLAQLLQSTAQDLGVPWDQAFDIEINLCAGARYVRQHLDALGSMQAAVLRYNGGGDPLYPNLLEARARVIHKYTAF